MSTRNKGLKIGAGALLAFSLAACAGNPSPAASTTPLSSAGASSAASGSASAEASAGASASADASSDATASAASDEASMGASSEATPAEEASTAPAADATASADASADPSASAEATATASDTDGSDKKDKDGKDQKDSDKKDSTALKDVALCSAEDLKASLTSSGSSWELKLTNNGKSACALGGYPGLLLNDADGYAVGEPAAWEDGAEVSPVVLEPGKAAVSTLTATDPEKLECTPVESASALIFPPDLDGALTADARIKVCAETSSTVVSPFKAVS